MAKARVAPSKITTIPRPELQAATLAVQLSRILKQELIPATQELFYSDSEFVLRYLANDTKRFHTFVANKVQQIKNIINASLWKHVKTQDNPASRGTTVTGLINSIWLHGQSILTTGKYDTQKDSTTYGLLPADPEVKGSVVHLIQSQVTTRSSMID